MIKNLFLFGIGTVAVLIGLLIATSGFEAQKASSAGSAYQKAFLTHPPQTSIPSEKQDVGSANPSSGMMPESQDEASPLKSG